MPRGDRVAVVGGGAWGTAFASVCAEHLVTMMWAREPEVVEAVNEGQTNPLFLAGCALSPALRASEDMDEVVAGATVVAVAVPSPFFRTVLALVQPHIGPDVPVLSLSKGLEGGTLLRMSEVATEILVSHSSLRIGVLSGPNIAREVVAGQPSATVIALPDAGVAAALQTLMTTDALRVYTNQDVVGCEVGGVVKNVIALAAGMADGLGFGHNTLAALVTRGLAELTRLGVALGGDPLTFLGLAGIGDLMVTCQSPDSRNHHVGHELGCGRPLGEILGGMRSVAEGVRACEPLLQLAAQTHVEMPICEQVAAVLSGRTTAQEAVATLLHRQPRPELEGITR